MEFKSIGKPGSSAQRLPRKSVGESNTYFIVRVSPFPAEAATEFLESSGHS